MIRPIVAMLILVASYTNARAAAPCTDEAEVVAVDTRKNGADPSLAPPTEPAAVAQMRVGKQHHGAGIKRSRIVATQGQAAPEFQAAIDAYVAASDASDAPLILYNLAQTYRAAGRYGQAINQYRQFLGAGKPREPLRRLIECHIASMTAEIERAASTAPPRDVEPTPGVDMLPDSQSVERPPAMVVPVMPLQLATGERPAWYADGVGWGILGGGVAVAGAGAFLLLDANSLRTDAASEPRDDVRIDLRDRADSRQRWGAIATAAGAVLVAGGVVKLAITTRAPRSTARTSLRITPIGLALRGQF